MKEGRGMILTTILKPWRIILAILFILATVVIAVMYLISRSTYTQDNLVFEASGRVDVDVSVFYIDNESFLDNPISQDLNFLMSFTDFIEIDSRLFARFSEEVEVHYSYTSVKRLIVRYRGTSNGEMHPIVFEIRYPLSDITDSLTSRELNFPDPDAHPSVGTYTISPERYIELYLDFVSEHNQTNISRNHANFFAELQIEFTYDLTIPTWGMNERIMRSYRLPLSTEVYSFMSTGDSTFSRSIDLPTPTQQVPLPIIMLFVIALTLSTYLLFIGLKVSSTDPNEFRREVLEITKKYANEIVDSKSSLLDLVSSEPQYTYIQIHKFESLLNLAINANEQIIGYHDDKRAEFVVVKGTFIYYYEI